MWSFLGFSLAQLPAYGAIEEGSVSLAGHEGVALVLAGLVTLGEEAYDGVALGCQAQLDRALDGTRALQDDLVWLPSWI